MVKKLNEGLLRFLIRKSNIATFVAAFVVAGGAVYFFLTGDGESAKWLVGLGAGFLFATAAMSKGAKTVTPETTSEA